MESLYKVDNLEQLRWAHKSGQNKFSDFISIAMLPIHNGMGSCAMLND